MSLPERVPYPGTYYKTATFVLQGGLFHAAAARYENGRRVETAVATGPTRYGARLQALEALRHA